MQNSDKTKVQLNIELRDLQERLKELDQVKRDLQLTQEYARSIIDCSLDMIITVDNDRKIMEFNKAAEESFGYHRKDVLGKHVSILYAESTEAKSVYETTVNHKRNIQEIQNRRKNGEIFPCLLASSILFDSQGESIGLMGISRDITDVKRAEEERERLIVSLREALKNVKTLKGLIPICAGCKKIRSDEGFWQQVEGYIEDHSDAEFSHGMCPDCLKKTYPELYKDK